MWERSYDPLSVRTGVSVRDDYSNPPTDREVLSHGPESTILDWSLDPGPGSGLNSWVESGCGRSESRNGYGRPINSPLPPTVTMSPVGSWSGKTTKTRTSVTH